MADTTVPGAAAVHRYVTDQCRERPRREWQEEILQEVQQTLDRLDRGWPHNGVRFHVVVTCERPAV